MAGGGGIADGVDVVWAINLEVGAFSTGVAGQQVGATSWTGGWSKDGLGRWGGRDGAVGWGISTFHKGFSDLGSKSG